MDKRMYKFVGVQVVDEKVDMHLSKNRYWFDLQNKKGLGNFTVFAVENEISAKDILNLASQDETIVGLGLLVADEINTRLEKIIADETRLANKGKVKRGRKPVVKTVEVETEAQEDELMTEADLADIVNAGTEDALL